MYFNTYYFKKLKKITSNNVFFFLKELIICSYSDLTGNPKVYDLTTFDNAILVDNFAKMFRL